MSECVFIPNERGFKARWPWSTRDSCVDIYRIRSGSPPQCHRHIGRLLYEIVMLRPHCHGYATWMQRIHNRLGIYSYSFQVVHIDCSVYQCNTFTIRHCMTKHCQGSMASTVYQILIDLQGNGAFIVPKKTSGQRAKLYGSSFSKEL